MGYQFVYLLLFLLLVMMMSNQVGKLGLSGRFNPCMVINRQAIMYGIMMLMCPSIRISWNLL